MVSKEFDIEGIRIRIIKNKRNRRIRLTISNNEVKVSIPYFVPYLEGLKFAKTKLNWIKTKIKPKTFYQEGQKIGKYHSLMIKAADQTKPTSRIGDIFIDIKYPDILDINSLEVQKYIELKVNKALKIQAQKLIPKRVEYLAQKYGFEYQNIQIKHLKTRWGSCDSHKNLTFNLKLMNLEWELIDYVILHELTHTKHMHHQKSFWDDLISISPNAKILRNKLKES